jgi:hypothetical protein
MYVSETRATQHRRSGKQGGRGGAWGRGAWGMGLQPPAHSSPHAACQLTGTRMKRLECMRKKVAVRFLICGFFTRGVTFTMSATACKTAGQPMSWETTMHACAHTLRACTPRPRPVAPATTNKRTRDGASEMHVMKGNGRAGGQRGAGPHAREATVGEGRWQGEKRTHPKNGSACSLSNQARSDPSPDPQAWPGPPPTPCPPSHTTMHRAGNRTATHKRDRKPPRPARQHTPSGERGEGGTSGRGKGAA